MWGEEGRSHDVVPISDKTYLYLMAIMTGWESVLLDMVIHLRSYKKKV